MISRSRWWVAVGLGIWLTGCGDGVIGEVSSESLPGDPEVPGDEPPEEMPSASPVVPIAPPVKPELPTSLEGWQFFGPQNGGPKQILGVSSDKAGNIWVAGGDEGLFLLAYGSSQFRRFSIADGLTPLKDPAKGDTQQPVISVAGAAAGTVFVGYRGVHAGKEEADPAYMVKSGDVDKVTLSLGTAITVTHLDISSPKGTPGLPNGREKIRDIRRILYNAKTGDVWFGGNHGVAMYDARLRKVVEHVHAHILGYLPSGARTMLSGDWYGIGLDAAGDLWMGGGHRLAKNRFATLGRKFYALQKRPYVDVWPDENPSETNAQPEDRTDDFVQDLAIGKDGSVWVGSIPNALARLPLKGTREYIRDGLVNPKVTALETDPLDGSIWVGSIYAGLTRINGTTKKIIGEGRLGRDLIVSPITDIQSDTLNGNRRILVAFGSGAVGVYIGP